MENIFGKTLSNFKRNFWGIFFIIIFQAIIIKMGYKILSPLKLTTVVIAINFISIMFVGIITDYIDLECYLALRENRKVRVFGILHLFMEYDSELFLLSLNKNAQIAFLSILFAAPGFYASYLFKRVIITKVENYSLENGEIFKQAKEEMNGRKLQLLIYDFLFALPAIISSIYFYILGIKLSLYKSGHIHTSPSLTEVILGIICFYSFTFIYLLLRASLNATFQSELTNFLYVDYYEDLYPIEYNFEKDIY